MKVNVKHPDPRPFEVDYLDNPSQATLRELALEYTPAVLRSAVGSIDKIFPQQGAHGPVHVHRGPAR